MQFCILCYWAQQEDAGSSEFRFYIRSVVVQHEMKKVSKKLSPVIQTIILQKNTFERKRRGWIRLAHILIFPHAACRTFLNVKTKTNENKTTLNKLLFALALHNCTPTKGHSPSALFKPPYLYLAAIFAQTSRLRIDRTSERSYGFDTDGIELDVIELYRVV